MNDLIDGVAFPTRRPVYARSSQDERVLSPALIEIVFRSFSLA